MRRPLGTILALVVGLLLAGCATSFKSDVARFHQLPPPAGETFVVVPKTADKQGSLEFAQYAAQISNHLAAYGYRPAPAGATPNLIVKLDYSIDDGRTEIRSYPSSFYGGFYSPFYRPWYWGYPGYPGYMGFYDNEIRSTVVYSRRLEMDIDQVVAGNRPQRVFEGRVESVGRDNRLTEVVPYMIDAMFKDFPGQNGVTQRVEIPTERGANTNY